MDDVTRARLERLGREVADASDRGADRDVLAQAKSRFLAGSAITRPPPRIRSRSWAMLAAAAALALAAACVVVFQARSRSELVKLEAGDPPVAVMIGEWMAASSDAALDVRSSDGSHLELAAGGRARVTEATSRGATVLLEHGALDASIHHAKADTHWSFRAGPFDVAVVGTRFHVAWSAATEVFELTMVEGTVTVRGPLLPEGRSLSAGERLRIGVRDAALELSRVDARVDPSASPTVASVVAAPAPTSLVATAPTSSASPSTGPSSVAPSSSTSGAYRDLLAAGKYGDAMDAIEQAGFSATIERAPASELLAIADAARFAGKPARAKETLLALRRRFGARGRSAFLLGKIAADSHASGDAASWFDTYLREEPRGALAEQALGRLMELKKSDKVAARGIAERYLASYPNGAYAALARSLISP